VRLSSGASAVPVAGVWEGDTLMQVTQ
jgi:hypothetical protein